MRIAWDGRFHAAAAVKRIIDREFATPEGAAGNPNGFRRTGDELELRASLTSNLALRSFHLCRVTRDV